ncbi:MAG: hypothetical protein HUU21_03265 [Polyangiaceae bacterium]|nr:hypothetical protein [Polyangiaceae bacterium]
MFLFAAFFGAGCAGAAEPDGSAELEIELKAGAGQDELLINSTWTPTGDMLMSRTLFELVPLANGKVIAIGGAALESELYDPATGSWGSPAPMSSQRHNFIAVTLLDGRILVAGGTWQSTLATAEIYDPATNSWSNVASMTIPRKYHAATVLESGKVLVVSGYTAGDVLTKSTEIYDPATNTWTSAQPLSTGRVNPVMVRLNDGRAFVVLGAGGGTTSELFDLLAHAADKSTGTFGLLMRKLQKEVQKSQAKN